MNIRPSLGLLAAWIGVGVAHAQIPETGFGSLQSQRPTPSWMSSISPTRLLEEHATQDIDSSPEPEDSAKDSAEEVEKEETESERETLTDHWWGRGDILEDSGLSIELNGTYVFQGVAGGGLVGPLFDLFSDENDTGNTFGSTLQLALDTEKAGLWQSGSFGFRLDSRAGRSIVQRAGSVSAVNNVAIVPNVVDAFDEATIAITEFTYTHSPGEGLSFYAGLLNTAEGDENEIAGSALSNSHFLNSALLYSLVQDATVPNASLGGGLFYEPSESASISLAVFGSAETAGENPFDHWNGTTFSGEWWIAHQLADRPGGQTFGWLYGIDAERTDIAADPRIVLGSVLLGLPIPTTEADTWSVYYNVYQYVVGDSDRGWGLFGRWGFSDGNPNPVQWNAALGAGGTGWFPARPNDGWGLGVYYLSMSDADLLRGLGVGDEFGGEYFYRMAFKPWFQVTLDTQVIDSALPNIDLTTVLGLRAHIIF